MTDFVDFQAELLRKIAASLSIPYEALKQDFVAAERSVLSELWRQDWQRLTDQRRRVAGRVYRRITLPFLWQARAEHIEARHRAEQQGVLALYERYL